MRIQIPLPPGLVYHCETCRIAIPADAPKPAVADCATPARRKFGQLHRDELTTGHFAQAVASWSLIHHEALNGLEPDLECVEYWRQFRFERKAHFQASAVRAALTPEQVDELRTFGPTHPHRELKKARDRWLLED